jgi:hypothetical protein
MSAVLAWVVVLTICIVGTYLFRQGRLRSWVAIYRSDSLPVSFRNAPLVIPFFVVAFAGPLVLLAPSTFGLRLDLDLPHRVEGLVLFGVLGTFLTSMGLSCAFMFRPPARLVPRWLRDEDDAIGYVRPKPTGSTGRSLASAS